MNDDDKDHPEKIAEETLEDVQGGAGFLKIGDIKGESLTSRFDLVDGVSNDTLFAGSVDDDIGDVFRKTRR